MLGYQSLDLPYRPMSTAELLSYRLKPNVDKFPRILQALLHICLGSGDAVKGIVEEGDDALLLGAWGDWKQLLPQGW